MSGFDTSHEWRTDTLPFMERPIYQFVLLDGYQEHSGRLWYRRWAGTATISSQPDSRFGYRREDIDRIQRDGDMVVATRVVGWAPAAYPRWDFDCDSGSDPQGENAGTAVEGEASQSGAPESAHRPETSTPSSTGAGQ